jgi:hypothetical protein
MDLLDRPVDRGNTEPARKIAKISLLTLGLGILATQLPLLLRIEVPAPGFEWLDDPHLTMLGTLSIFAAKLVSEEDQSSRRFWLGIILVLVAIAAVSAAVRYFKGAV